jgi:hypothetical protein
MKPLSEWPTRSKITFTTVYLISLLNAVFSGHGVLSFLSPIAMLLIVSIGPMISSLYDSYKEARGNDLERAIRRYHGGTGPR